MTDHSDASLQKQVVAVQLQDMQDLLWRFFCCTLGSDVAVGGRWSIEDDHSVLIGA